MSAGRDSLIVPKANVSYVLWNRLIGVNEPARLDEATGTPPLVSGQAGVTAGVQTERN